MEVTFLRSDDAQGWRLAPSPNSAFVATGCRGIAILPRHTSDAWRARQVREGNAAETGLQVAREFTPTRAFVMRCPRGYRLFRSNYQAVDRLNQTFRGQFVSADTRSGKAIIPSSTTRTRPS